MGRLTDRVALVTGASRGLGKAIALRLAAEGADVLVHYHQRGGEAEAVGAAIRAMGRRAVVAQADVADGTAVQAMVDRARAALGRVDVLVANAGYAEAASIFELTEAQWARMLAVTLKGTFLCVKAVISAMRAQGGGRIITISSDVGKRGGLVTGPHYSAAKGGVLGLMRGLARQLAAHQITVNDVCPADIFTEAWAARPAERVEAARRGVPLGRLGAPEDVAGAVAFLASDDARHITGASLNVTGGALIR